jgi:DNA-binding XRE family transcriptional regulator
VSDADRARAVIKAARNRVLTAKEIADDAGITEAAARDGLRALIVAGEIAVTDAGHFRRATPADEGFAARLRQLRQAFGLSVAGLAGKAGLSRTHLHNLESGVREPKLETARRLAKALGVSLGVFDVP